MRGRRTHPNAEPGTGTQYATLASPPNSGDDKPSTYTANGKKWLVGREYWDADLRDLVELVEVVGKSSWCDTRGPEDCPGTLVFESRNGRMKIDPHRPDDELEERFTLRSIDDPAGVEREMWNTRP